jgi:GH15 family glucan-1,4-alpha-glucosidase
VSQPLEDYALIGDTHTAALVGRDGSIDWLCVPRFDGGACFAALLGNPEHGRWLLAPSGAGSATRRWYLRGSLVLVQEWETPTGTVRVTDFMPPRETRPRVYRRAECLSGRVEMSTELVIRFEYGSQVPWVMQTGTGIRAIAGADSVVVDSPLHLRGVNMRHGAHFVLHEGQKREFRMQWEPSFEDGDPGKSCEEALKATTAYWEEWSKRLNPIHGGWEDMVTTSLVTLKALTYAPSGGIVAAPTTSLPEALGGSRNWDYRFCWVRDGALTIDGLVLAGLREEAEAWLLWLRRAVAGTPSQLQVLYGLAGERRLPELELDWLPGYEASRPVRVGNAAALQFQLDVFGELMDAVDVARSHGIQFGGVLWEFQKALLDYVSRHWDQPDQGIWELRGPPQRLVYSRVMAWVAMDRGVNAVERYGYKGPVERWRKVRDEIFEQVCENGYDKSAGTFTQAYGSLELDASLLMIPLVGFLPVSDPRVVGTVEAVQRELLVDGFVARYKTSSGVDGLAGEEATFLPCTLWLVSCLALMGRTSEAHELMGRVADVANELGLFSEEYDTKRRRQVGNFPQAFTHVAFVNAARTLAAAEGSSRSRRAPKSRH